jgi:hypothetical protein
MKFVISRVGCFPASELRNLLVFRLTTAGQAAYLKGTAGVNRAQPALDAGAPC